MQSSAPESHGMDAMEIWITVCNLMIFAALCEYALVLFIRFRRTAIMGTEKEKLLKHPKVDIAENGEQNVDDIITSETKADKISLILFPVSFFVFVFIYLIHFYFQLF